MRIERCKEAGAYADVCQRMLTYAYRERQGSGSEAAEQALAHDETERRLSENAWFQEECQAVLPDAAAASQRYVPTNV